MKRLTSLIALSLIAAVLSAPSRAAAAVQCFNNWSMAAPIARQQGLMTLDKLSTRIAMQFNSRLVKVVLCRKADRFFYRIVVKTNDGRLDLMRVDAKSSKKL